MRSMMAVAIIGGTIASTLLTLHVIPSFYGSIEIWREKFGRLVARLRGKLAVRADVISAK